MKECLRSESKQRGKVSKASTKRREFTDVARSGAPRRPLSSCGYRVINSRNSPRSLRTHCNAYHKTAWKTFTSPAPPEVSENIEGSPGDQAVKPPATQPSEYEIRAGRLSI